MLFLKTTFLCVVDPGVGSSRSAIAIRAKNGNVFVGPDNGLMWNAVLLSSSSSSGDSSINNDIYAVRLSTEHAKSSTFHGRDIFSPAAAKIASGVSLDSLGTPISVDTLVKMNFISECVGNKVSVGEVVSVDSFGNIITSAPASLDELRIPGKILEVKVNGEYIGKMTFCRTYAEAKESELFVIEGSCSSLEISLKNGNASKRLPSVSIGMKVEFYVDIFINDQFHQKENVTSI